MPSKTGRIGRKQLEDDMREYFGAIKEKPILNIEVVSLKKPNIKLNMENMIVLFILDSYRLYKLFNVQVSVVPERLEDPAKEECVDVVSGSGGGGVAKGTVNNDSNVCPNIVIYESEFFFEEAISTNTTASAITISCSSSSSSSPSWSSINTKESNGNGKEKAKADAKAVFLDGDGDGIGAESEGCKKPSVHLPQKKMHIAGLSAVLRFLLKFACRRQDVCENELKTNVENIDVDVEILDKLLGYQRSCLQACAESSIWTRFCEVDMIQMVCTLRAQLRVLVKEMTTTPIPTTNTTEPSSGPELAPLSVSDACNSINSCLLNVDVDGEMSLKLQELQLQQQPPPLSPRPLAGRGLLLEIPKDLLRLEYHLTRPVRIHNFRKRIQNQGSKDKQPGGNNQDPNHDDHGEIKDERKAPVNSRKRQVQEDQQQLQHPGQISHDFAEGPDLTLADLLLFPCVSLALVCLGTNIFTKYLPRVEEWHERLCKLLPIRPRVAFEEKLLSAIQLHSSLDQMQVQVQIPEIPQESLYKSDPSRYKATLRLFTKQDDIETALSFLSSRKIQTLNFNEDKMTAFHWDNFPRLVHPEGGHLPPSRIEKKSHQLSNLAQMVEKVFRDKYEGNFSPASTTEKVTIVDFCSGGGHLGILLAYMLPQCEVILVENKEESLRRAEMRVKLLGLSNISFYQCNLDYFTGHFEIGVALHACGTATDLVLTKCVEKRASFVCCPCCYGAIQSNHMLHYPRSSTFLQALNTSSGIFSLKHYFVLGHAADQTHDEANEKTQQGKVCMRMIDTDRCFHAQENNYHVSLRRMEPSFCSPKNHILVGVPS